MMRNQVFLELDSKNMDASVTMTFTPINFNVTFLQDIQLNFEDQGWAPKCTQICLYLQAAFEMPTLDFCLKFCNFLPKCVWHPLLLHPKCLNSSSSVCLFDNANILSFPYIILYLQLSVCSHLFRLCVCLFVCLSKKISLSLPYPLILRLFTTVAWIHCIATSHDRAHSSLSKRSKSCAYFLHELWLS